VKQTFAALLNLPAIAPTFAASDASATALAMRTLRRTVDGMPILAWRDLVANIGTLTINKVALPLIIGLLPPGPSHLACPTPLQSFGFKLLDVPLRPLWPSR